MLSNNCNNIVSHIDNDWLIVIPTLNRPKEIKITLDWILNFKTYPKSIYIIDQSSEINNDLVELINSANIHIHYEYVGRPLGSGYARNYLMGLYDTKYILFLDDDVHSDDSSLDLINIYSSYFKSNSILSYIDGGYFPTIITKSFNRERYIDLKSKFGFINVLTTTYNNPENDFRPIIGLTAGNFAIKTCDFIRVNGFDNRYGLGEDRELGFRLWKYGFVGINVKSCRLIHRKSILGGMRNSNKKILFSTDYLIFLFGLENFPKFIVYQDFKFHLFKSFKSIKKYNVKNIVYALLKSISVILAFIKAIRNYHKVFRFK